MHSHRFSDHFGQQRIAAPQAQPFNPAAFCAWPLGLPAGAPAQAGCWQQRLYQLAFEEAQAVVRPSWLERDLLGVWN
jgi:hypothetical protein